jgi:hypothetical protein
MAANLKKSLLTNAQVLVCLLGVLLIGSCNEGPKPDKDLVCIKVPKDTSDLGRIDHFIPLATIKTFKSDFNSTRDSFARKFPDIYLPQAEVFNKASIVDVLNLDSCVGLKIYYGVKPGKQKQVRVMIVGVDKNGKDLYLKKGSGLATEANSEEGGLEYGQCPPPCSSAAEN